MTIDIFVFKGDLNGENRSGAFLFLSGIVLYASMLNSESLLSIVSSRAPENDLTVVSGLKSLAGSVVAQWLSA